MELSKVNIALLTLIKAAMTQSNMVSADINFDNYDQWQELFDLAKRHGVLGLIYPVIKDMSGVPEAFMSYCKKYALRTINNSYKMLSFAYTLQSCLENAGVESVIMKGVAAAKYFPYPELRKIGDVDILIKTGQYDKAEATLLEAGFNKIGDIPVHGEFEKDGIIVEVHRVMVDSTPSDSANKRIQQIAQDGVARRVVFSVEDKASFYIFPEAINGLRLLLHMLHHFLMGGFGIKLLCDWSAFVENINDSNTRIEIHSYIEQLGLRKFTATLTKICVDYCGLSVDKASPFIYSDINIDGEMTLLNDILNADETLSKNPEYMVVLDKPTIGGLIRQFHYQMKHNHAKASKCVLLWPILWVVTLVVFLWNNKFVRHVKTSEATKGALKRASAVSTSSLELFKN